MASLNSTLAIGNLTTSINSNSTAICTLSPHARALSTVLTAFVGSIIGGISGGYFTAFYTAWVCWMASFRILVVAIWEVCEALQGHPLLGGDQFHVFYGQIPVLGKLVTGSGGIRDFDDPFFREDAEAKDPTFLGWLGWLWSVAYSPVIQILWLVENWNKAAGSLKIVRAIGVSVTALPLTMDTRGRYGAALGNLIGRWSEKVFNLWTAASCLVLGVVASIELVLGAREAQVAPYIIAIYVLFMLVWTYAGLVFATPHDETRSVNSLSSFLAGLAMGAFGGLFTAMPAFIVLRAAQSTPGDSLSTYVKCESVALWQKLVSFLP